MVHVFFERSWVRFEADETLARWVAAALPAARAAVLDPLNARWLRCGGTWFAGVNVLGNDATGAVAGGPPLQGAAVDFIAGELGLSGISWDSGQVSVCYPGYPRPSAEETPAAFRYRLENDAAHIDGIARDGPERRRFVREHHGFILGLPLSTVSAGASPLVVWEGSHEIVRAELRDRLAGIELAAWRDIDITDTYAALRRRVRAECRRVLVPAIPGEAYVLHRLAMHGVSPWQEDATAGPDGRMIAYFRPELPGPADWLDRP
ncbi:MAG: hypothetical protein R3D33_08655 [Hyphomicrobiaceae bacterium]